MAKNIYLNRCSKLFKYCSVAGHKRFTVACNYKQYAINIYTFNFPLLNYFL